MENYICINGKKAELTEEQMKALGIDLPKVSPFERVKEGDIYYFIDHFNGVSEVHESKDPLDDRAFRNGNYCTDKSLMEQRTLHEILNRLLWRYSMEHDGDKICWNDDYTTNSQKAFIYYNHVYKRFDVETRWDYQFFGNVWFNTIEIALNAIEEIVKPFIKSHPNFKL